jgi:hypothetical protein
MLRHFSGPTHKDTDELKLAYKHRCDYAELCCVLSEDTEGTAFSPAFLIKESVL